MNKHTKRKVRLFFAFLIPLLLIFAFITSNNAKKAEQERVESLFENPVELNVQEFRSQGNNHISSPTNFAYNSNPPTSGPHYPKAPAWGFYPEAIDDESALHAVEHGGMWVSYRDLDESDIEILREFAKKHNQSVIISPRPENSTPIALVMWTRLVELEEIDLDQMEKFLLLYKNDTHEPLAR